MPYERMPDQDAQALASAARGAQGIPQGGVTPQSGIEDLLLQLQSGQVAPEQLMQLLALLAGAGGGVPALPASPQGPGAGMTDIEAAMLGAQGGY